MSIADNIALVEEEIAAACRRAGRPRADVRLMAVSKTHPPEWIVEAFANGVRLFGENRVQEYAGKRVALTAAAGLFTGPEPAKIHCIGPLQSNKAVRAVQIFDVIDTVDSLRLAERLEQAAAEAGKCLPMSIEIKLSPEASKHGFIPDTAELNQLLERLPDLHHLDAQGFMMVPPFVDDIERVRPYFHQLLLLRDSIARRYPRLALNELSMGMSHDFPVAIEEGATLVRIGTAIFGARPSK